MFNDRSPCEVITVTASVQQGISQKLGALTNQFQSNLKAIKALHLSIPLHEVLLSQILI
jgi:hypothetical protein